MTCNILKTCFLALIKDCFSATRLGRAQVGNNQNKCLKVRIATYMMYSIIELAPRIFSVICTFSIQVDTCRQDVMQCHYHCIFSGRGTFVVLNHGAFYYFFSGFKSWRRRGVARWSKYCTVYCSFSLIQCFGSGFPEV